MKVPFLDLQAHHAPLIPALMAAIEEVANAGAFSGGPFVERFEKAFGNFCGAKCCIGVSSGTDALWLALRALEVKRGDEVITVPMTFMATVEAITQAGATPVFVDITPGSYTIDVSQIEAAITPRTKAIIPVHLFGQCADMDPIMDLAKQRQLFVVEDAAQAHGALYKGRRAGTLGDVAAFSFYPGKNLGAWGEAGAITTQDSGLRDRLVMLREHGQRKKYHHELVGWNARMDGIQAAVLGVKLAGLEIANQRRRQAAAHYERLLSDLPNIVLPEEASYAQHVYHVFAVRTSGRDALATHLSQQGVMTGIHYPVPVHLQKAYADLGCRRGDFPVSERCADEFLSLPMFPEIQLNQLEAVSTAVRAQAFDVP